MNTLQMIAFGLSSLLTAAQGGTTLQPDPPMVCDSCDEWNAPVAPFRIFGNTYYVGVAGLSAILVTSDAGHMLLDGALSQSAVAIDRNIRTLGFKTTDIRLIVNSHTHFDHAGAIAALQRVSGATVAASASAARALEQGGPEADDPQYAFGVEANRIPKVKAVRVITDGETLKVGALALTAHLTPGHTPGATTWSWRSCEGTRCLDMVYADSMSAVSAPGFRFTGDATHPSLVSSFRRSIATVAALPCDIVIAAHPFLTGMEQKLAARARGVQPDPFIDREGCRAFAAEASAKLDKRIAEEQPAPAGGGGRRAFDLTTPRPIPALDSVWIEELTWMEVRDAMAAGRRTAIIAAGSTEQNGPYVPTGKHVYVLRTTAEAIARQLGDALVAPLVPFEPGAFSTTPGTIQLRPETFEAIVEDEAQSLKANGFTHVVLIGDSGGNQRGLQRVAQKLSAAWAGGATTIHYIPEYYDSWEAADGAWTSLGVPKTMDEGIHDDYSVNAIIAVLDPGKVRFAERQAVGKASVNGQSLLPLATTVANGRKLLEIRAGITVAAIRKATGTR